MIEGIYENVVIADLKKLKLDSVDSYRENKEVASDFNSSARGLECAINDLLNKSRGKKPLAFVFRGVSVVGDNLKVKIHTPDDCLNYNPNEVTADIINSRGEMVAFFVLDANKKYAFRQAVQDFIVMVSEATTLTTEQLKGA